MYDHIRKLMIVAMLSTGAMGVWAQSQIEGHLCKQIKMKRSDQNYCMAAKQ